MMTTDEQLATDLLTPLWRGISPDYKRKYARSIWQQFEDNLRSAAYTGHLSTFYAKIVQRLDILLHKDDTEKVAAILHGEDKAKLKMLREETTLLVLLVRVSNEERKVKFAKKIKEQPSEDVSVSGPSDRTLFD